MLEPAEFKNKLKKTFVFICKFLLLFIISFSILKIFYRNVEIKALHLDDLHNLVQHLKYPNLLSWIIPYFENRMHYRPIFNIIFFILIKIIGTNVSLTLTINFVLYSCVTTILYFLARSINIKWYFSLFIIIISSIINFNYYEIYQLIGFIEGFPMLFSMVLLVLSINFVVKNNINIYKFLVITSIIYLIMVYIHERYFPMILIPIIAISFNNTITNNIKYKIYLIYSIELLFFFLVRYYHLRIWIPRGTDCTSLVENFNFKRTIIFIYHQLLYLLGVNLGPEYLCGINFFNYNNLIQTISIISIALFFILILLYIYVRLLNKNLNQQSKIVIYKNIDILFIIYIILCILQSSLTIRVELRWLLASFVCLLFYLTYILSYIIDFKECKEIIKLFSIFIFIAIFVIRSYMCFYFRNNSIYIFIINEQNVVNNLYSATVEKYGIDKIKNSKILITSNRHNTLIEEEKTHFFDQFDHNLSEKQIIYIDDTIDKNINDNYDIILDEVDFLDFSERVIK